MNFKMLVMLSVAVAACGVDGKDGAAGLPGARGLPGLDGVGLSKSIHCNNLVLVDQGRGLTADIIYDYYQFADGSVMTTCNVSLGQIGVEGVSMYKKAQQGASTGSCLVRDDVDNSSGGFWTFDLNSTTTPLGPKLTAAYTDFGGTYHGRSWVITCTVY